MLKILIVRENKRKGKRLLEINLPIKYQVKKTYNGAVSWISWIVLNYLFITILMFSNILKIFINLGKK